MKKEILHFDLDGILAAYPKAIAEGKNPNDIGFYENLEPMPDAIESVNKLAPYYDMYILSTPAWSKPHSWGEKKIWVEKHFGDLFFKKIILSHSKDLVMGDYLVDDHEWNGAKEFVGKLLHVGSEEFPTLKSATEYLLAKVKEKEESVRANHIYMELGYPQRGKTKKALDELDEFTKKGNGLGALFPMKDLEPMVRNSMPMFKSVGMSKIVVPMDTEVKILSTKTIDNPLSNKNWLIRFHNTPNTMNTETKKSYPELLKELKEAIRTELDLCEQASTPTVCSMKATPEGYLKLEELIISHVADGGFSIAQAIIEVERAYNPNMVQD